LKKAQKICEKTETLSAITNAKTDLSIEYLSYGFQDVLLISKLYSEKKIKTSGKKSGIYWKKNTIFAKVF
jgi:hypothetical protein